MKKIVRLTEADLVRIVKRVIKEDNQDLLSCIAKAANMTRDELIKLTPCLELQKNPTDTTKIQACLQAAIPVAQSKINFDITDPIGSAKRIADLATKMAACASTITPQTPVMNERRSRRW